MRITRVMRDVPCVTYSLTLRTHSSNRVKSNQIEFQEGIIPEQADPYLLSIRMSEICGRFDLSYSRDQQSWGFRGFTQSFETNFSIVDQTRSWLLSSRSF
jgi:hypothetical protein